MYLYTRILALDDGARCIVVLYVTCLADVIVNDIMYS